VKSLPEDWARRVWSLDGGPFAALIREGRVPVDVHERSWRWDVTPTLSLWQLIKAWQPDLIHTNGYMSTLAAVPFARSFRIPLVDGSIRQANIPTYRGRILKWSLRWSDRVIANSQAGLRAFGIESARGRVVYNGFAADRLDACDHVRTTKEHLFTVIMVGRMHPMKDYLTYVDAARLLAAKQDGWRFIAVGDGPLRDSLMNTATDLVEKGLLSFPEPTLEVLPYIAQADVGVLLTKEGVHEEGCSNAVMEYMACGLPVICSASGGNHELVLHGQTGFIIESGNPGALAERVLWLRSDAERARKMGRAGRERIRVEFSVENLVAGTLAVYEEVLREEA
jgi:glycosyltransferase involved in cell wall biosynthesis